MISVAADQTVSARSNIAKGINNMRILSIDELEALARLRSIPESEREINQVQAGAAIVLGDMPPVMNQVIYSAN